MEFDAAADALYGVPPDDFVRTREEWAKKAKATGDQQLARRIRGLKRPSRSAWLVNILVRERSDDVRQLLELGSALRVAQEQLDSDEMRRLGGQRHRVVMALGRAAAGLARDAGAPVSDAVGREVEQTLDAALSDPEAAAAVSEGRLTAALSYAGLGAIGPTPSRVDGPARPQPSRDKQPTAGTAARPAADTKALRTAREKVDEARRNTDRAEREAAEAAEALAETARERDEKRGRLEDLERQLAGVRDALKAAESAAREAQRRRDSTERTARSARRTMDKAVAELTRLSEEEA